eukprot:TRINITY_DN986_c0_g1_i2.p1 TRINITY_DN986_c0_g1~~TRINITY_DN986_c0_g1_i2.p1  ORF type:complete len:271 (+),score=64.35 TRINITY_DN986_c0_g1_i2:163-975(+)
MCIRDRYQRRVRGCPSHTMPQGTEGRGQAMDRAVRLAAHIKPQPANTDKPFSSRGLPKVGDESFYDPDFPSGLEKMAKNVPPELGLGYYTEYGAEKLLVTKPEYATIVLQENVEHYLWGGISKASQCFFGEKVLFVVEGEEWQTLRRLLRPNLMQNNLSELCDDVAAAASALVDRLNPLAGSGKPVNVLHAAQAFHLDATGQALYDHRFGTVEAFPAPHPIVEAFNFFLDELPRRSFDPSPEVSEDYTTDNPANRAMWHARDKVIVLLLL